MDVRVLWDGLLYGHKKSPTGISPQGFGMVGLDRLGLVSGSHGMGLWGEWFGLGGSSGNFGNLATWLSVRLGYLGCFVEISTLGDLRHGMAVIDNLNDIIHDAGTIDCSIKPDSVPDFSRFLIQFVDIGGFGFHSAGSLYGALGGIGGIFGNLATWLSRDNSWTCETIVDDRTVWPRILRFQDFGQLILRFCLCLDSRCHYLSESDHDSPIGISWQDFDGSDCILVWQSGAKTIAEFHGREGKFYRHG